MGLAKCACIDTLYTELPWRERFFGRQGGWICGGGVLGLASAGSGGNARMAERERITLHLEALNIYHGSRGEFFDHHADGRGNLPSDRISPLKLLYDVYHMQLNEGSLCDNIRKYSDQFGHVHVADAPGRHEPGKRGNLLSRGIPVSGGVRLPGICGI